jgi:hypothetical protein
MTASDETVSVPFTKEELELILGTFEETEFDDTDPDADDEDEDAGGGDPPEGSDAYVAERVQEKIKEYLAHLPHARKVGKEPA